MHIKTVRCHKNLSILISDEGHGIAEEDLKKVGSPFFTTKVNGTGLGMMVSQQIIKNHQGVIDISSKVGHGTTVTITLPVVSGA
ncbi:hypothetical protein LLE49_20405 [Alicyclobacillus tolerans]|uniref:ATP-binding protein n=1 Tax=Alicyclobacillus tolerans TaxID=90970 RepID=UPI0035560187|nr:hypothetical protein [Alicyclobacillus tolerans]